MALASIVIFLTRNNVESQIHSETNNGFVEPFPSEESMLIHV